MRKKTIGLAVALSGLFFYAQSHAVGVEPGGMYAPASGTLLYDYYDGDALDPDAGEPVGYVYGGTKWGSPTLGTGATVTYSFMATGVACNSGHCSSGSNVSLDSFMPLGWKAQIVRALDAWSNVADITFTEVADSGNPYDGTGGGDIRIGGHYFDGSSNVLAHAYYPSTGSLGGDTHFDKDEAWNVGFASGKIDIFQVAAHEIGHAIGLDHTNVANSLMNPVYSTAFLGPQADDISGAQHIYGAAAPVPVPAAVWLMFSGLLALFRFGRRGQLQVAAA